MPDYFSNVGGGETHGLEIFMKYSPVRRWTLSTGITGLRGYSAAAATYSATKLSPREQVNVQSELNLTQHVNFDAAYYYDDAIPNAVPPVNRVDVGISTRSIHGFTFSVWGRNLQQSRHQESIPQFAFSGGEIRRSVAFKLIWESNPDQGKGIP